MMTLSRYTEAETETIDVPMTREDALDMANEKMRCGSYEGAGFYFECAMAIEEPYPVREEEP